MAISTPHLYPVRLTPNQRQELEDICRAGKAGARKIRRAQVLLLSDHNRPGGKLLRAQVAQATGLHINSVDRIRKSFCEQGPQATLVRKAPAQPPVPQKVDGKAEAQIIAICCSPAPAGYARWTLSLLTDEIIKRRIITSISVETVRRTLKKTNYVLGANGAGASLRGTRRGS